MDFTGSFFIYLASNISAEQFKLKTGRVLEGPWSESISDIELRMKPLPPMPKPGTVVEVGEQPGEIRIHEPQ